MAADKEAVGLSRVHMYERVIQVLHNRGVKFSGKKRYEGVRFNIIRVTREWVGVQFTGKRR